MAQQFILGVLFFFSAVVAMIGCVPSEETGAGRRAKNPVQIFGPIDTTHRMMHRAGAEEPGSIVKIDSGKIVQGKKPRVAPKFKSQQDTVRASVVIKSKSLSHPLIKIIRPEHPVYTVQIGAFGKVSNALRVQKKAKEHFAFQPVYNTYVKRARLYRVSIGRYEHRDDAFALHDSLKQSYPDEYKKCWINFIP